MLREWYGFVEFVDCGDAEEPRALAVHDPAIWQQWFKPLHLLPADVIEQVTSDDSPTS